MIVPFIFKKNSIQQQCLEHAGYNNTPIVYSTIYFICMSYRSPIKYILLCLELVDEKTNSIQQGLRYATRVRLTGPGGRQTIPSRGCFHGSRRDASFSACIPAKAASTPRNGRWTYYNYRAPMAAPGFPLRPPSPTAEETRRDGTVRASFPIVTPGAAVPTSSSNRWRRALLRRRGICCSRFGS